MKMTQEKQQEKALKRAAREKEISKIKVKQEDVDLIVSNACTCFLLLGHLAILFNGPPYLHETVGAKSRGARI